MKKRIKKEEAEEIISKSLAALGLSENMETSPILMKKIIKEIKLNNFESKTNKIDLSEIQREPQSLKPLFLDIKNALTVNHPAIIEFLEVALKKGWLKKTDMSVRAVHFLYILEYLTSAMCNDNLFFNEFCSFIRLKEKKHKTSLDNPIKAFFKIYQLSGTFFGLVKTLSVDPIMIHFSSRFRNFKLSKKQLSRCLKKGELNYFEYKLLTRKNKTESFNDLMKINLYEAGIADYNKKLDSNAFCAMALFEELKNDKIDIKYRKMKIIPKFSKNLFYQKLEENYSVDFPVSQEWQSLYISWNLAFIFGNLNNLDILSSKLLIPSILKVPSEQFAETRTISLWLAIKCVIFRLTENIDISGPENKNEIVREWGKINKKYAIDFLIQKKFYENKKETEKAYKNFYKNRYLKFFKLLFKLIK
jgi:hypothetical protein